MKTPKLDDLQKKAASIHSQLIRSEQFLKGVRVSIDNEVIALEARAKNLRRLSTDLEDYYIRLIGETAWLRKHCSDIHGVSKEELLAYVEVSNGLLKNHLVDVELGLEHTQLEEIIAHADKLIPLLQAANAAPTEKTKHS